MLKKLFVLFAMMYAAMAFAAVDANKATSSMASMVSAPAFPPKSLTSVKKALSKTGTT
jgi:hypothetical protein